VITARLPGAREIMRLARLGARMSRRPDSDAGRAGEQR
jgi:hypothetical protein